MSYLFPLARTSKSDVLIALHFLALQMTVAFGGFCWGFFFSDGYCLFFHKCGRFIKVVLKTTKFIFV